MKKIVKVMVLGLFFVTSLTFSSVCAQTEGSSADPAMEKLNDIGVLRKALAVREGDKKIEEIIAKLQTSHFKEVLAELKQNFTDEFVVLNLLKTVDNQENHPLLRAQAAWQLGEMCYSTDPLVSMPELKEALNDDIELVRGSVEYAIERLADPKGGVALVWDPVLGEATRKGKQALDEEVEKIYKKIKEKLIRFLEYNEPFDYNTHLSLLSQDKKEELLRIVEAAYEIEEQALQDVRKAQEQVK